MRQLLQGGKEGTPVQQVPHQDLLHKGVPEGGFQGSQHGLQGGGGQEKEEGTRVEEVKRKKKGDRREREEVGRKDSEEKKEELKGDVKKVLDRMPNPALRSVVIKVAETLEKVSCE